MLINICFYAFSNVWETQTESQLTVYILDYE